ncbi:hypothetical protein ABMA27_009352 [Loxostege sticticalis]|uniref:Uncharacterized protein n=1 Tax=Loxostege sticticalis TaxID=481309 RepID=A0ABR3H7M9_LOXSC
MCDSCTYGLNLGRFLNISELVPVAPIAEKIRESRLHWYGHIMRRDENHPVRRALSIPERPKGRGRPPATWWSNVQNEIRKQKLNPQTIRSRTLWRKCTSRPDPK